VRRAATDSGWEWNHRTSLEDLRLEMIRQDRWRDMTGGYIERGPFPKDPTGVNVQVLHRDYETGKVRLRISPVHGNKVYMSRDGQGSTEQGSTEWEVVDHVQDIETDDLTLAFISEDTTGEYQTGEP